MARFEFNDLDAELGRAAEGFRSLRTLAPLEQGIKAIKALLSHPEWSAQPDERQAHLLNQGGACLLNRFKLAGDPADLKQALQLLHVAAKLVPADDPDRGAILGNLGAAQRNAAEQFNDQDALDAAIETNREACRQNGDALANWGRRLNLAMALFWRFEMRGDADDVGEIRNLLQEAYETAPTPDYLAQVATNQAVVEQGFFSRSGETAELEKAVFFAQAAVALTPVGHRQRAIRLNNLAMCLGTRLMLSGDLADGRRAVTSLKESIATAPDDHVEQGARALNLGNTFMAMFFAGHDRQDLVAAVGSYEIANDKIGDGHSFKAATEIGLAHSLSRLGGLTNDRPMVDRSVAVALAAVKHAPHPSSQRPAALNAAATAFLQRAEMSKSAADVEAAQLALRNATELTPKISADYGLYRLALLRAHQIAARLASDQEALRTVIRDSAAVFAALEPRLLQPGGASALADRMAMARRELVADAIATGEPGLAVELIEQGKAVGLRRNMRRMERVPEGLDEAETSDYRQILARLRVLDAFLAAPGANTRLTSRAELAAEAALLAARVLEMERRGPTLPKTEDWDDVVDLAGRAGAAIAYIVVGDKRGGTAIIVHPRSDGVATDHDVLQLPNLEDGELQRLIHLGAELPQDAISAILERGPVAATAKLGLWTAYKAYRFDGFSTSIRKLAFETWRDRVSATLRWLDQMAMKHVAERLVPLGISRLILIPEARLLTLPLHAAPSLQNIQGVSYVPSAAILAQLMSRGGNREAHCTVMVADPDRSLPFAAAEAALIGETVQKSGGALSEGTELDWFRAAAPVADYLIVAAHALFDPADPYRSRIALNPPGSGLTLAALLAGSPPLKEGAVVFLNACETAMIGTRLVADEHLGFPAAFLRSGANFVSASLWVADDLATAIFSCDFQRRLAAGESCLEAMSRAVKTLRELTRDHTLSIIADFRRRGNVAQEVEGAIDNAAANIAAGTEYPFSHPIYWAGFMPNGVSF
jgi:CHAT domain-containing protein/tetratricopeptide (TPR) repeat protein